MKSAIKNKIDEIIDAVNMGTPAQAQNLITQVLEKPKFASKMTKSEKERITLLQAIVLTGAQEYSEAHKVVSAYFAEDNKDPIEAPSANEEMSMFRMYEKIAIQYDKMPDVRRHFEPVYKKNEKNFEVVQRYFHILVKEKNFGLAKSTALKLFNLTNNKDFYLASNWLSYLHSANCYADAKPEEREAKKQNMMKELNLLVAFQNKKRPEFLGTGPLSEDNLAGKQFVLLDAEVFFLQEKWTELAGLLQKNANIFLTYHEDLELLLRIPRDSFGSRNSLILQIYMGFEKRNSDLNKFTALFDLSVKCMDLLLSHESAPSVSDFSIEGKVPEDSEALQGLDCSEPEKVAQKSHKELLGLLVNTFRKNVAEKAANGPAQGHNNYLYYMKNNIFSLLHLACALKCGKRIEKAEGIEGVVKKLVELFGKNIAFVPEIDHFFKAYPELEDMTRKIILEKAQTETNPSRKVLFDVNAKKMCLYGRKPESKEEIIKEVSGLMDSYQLGFKTLYPSFDKAEKGERLLMDDYLIIALDLILEGIDKGLDNGDLVGLGMFLGYVGNKISPYNFDILIRRMILNSFSGLFEENIELSKINDIKGVQYETLSFLMFHAPLLAGFYSYVVENSSMAYIYISDSAREAKESMVHCIKFGNYSRIPEFVKFDQINDNSYIRVIYKFCGLENNFAKPKTYDQSWLISDILERLQRPGKTFSVDLRVAQRSIPGLSTFTNYFGPLNNPKALELLTVLRQLSNEVLPGDKTIAPGLFERAEGLIGSLAEGSSGDLKAHFDLKRHNFNSEPYSFGPETAHAKNTVTVFRDIASLRLNLYSALNHLLLTKNDKRDKLVQSIRNSSALIQKFASFLQDSIKSSSFLTLEALMVINLMSSLVNEFDAFNKAKTKLSKGLREHQKTESADSSISPENLEEMDTQIKDLPNLYKHVLKLIIDYVSKIVKEPQGVSGDLRKAILSGAQAASWEVYLNDFEGKLRGWQVSMSVIGIQTKCEKLMKKF